MKEISLKQSLASKGINLSNGLRASVHPFYNQVPEAAYFCKSLRDMVKYLEWPSGYSGTGFNYDYPMDQDEVGWTNNLQGITHDENAWYITQTEVLWGIPVDHDLDVPYRGTIGLFLGENGNAILGPNPVIGIGLSEKLRNKGYSHMGDCDYHEGGLWIPLEGSPPHAVALVRGRNLEVEHHSDQVAELDASQSEASWCAIHPLNGLLFSSNFDQVHELFVYKVINYSPLKLNFLGKFPLFDGNGQPRLMDRIQGGVFSPLGHLYLVVDDGTGIVGFDMITGRQSAHIPVDYQREIYGFGPKEEIEGITIWDLDNGQAPGISGQIHLLMIDNLGVGADDLYFKHYKVIHPEDKDKI